MRRPIGLSQHLIDSFLAIRVLVSHKPAIHKRKLAVGFRIVWIKFHDPPQFHGSLRELSLRELSLLQLNLS